MKKSFLISSLFGLSLVAASACDCFKPVVQDACACSGKANGEMFHKTMRDMRVDQGEMLKVLTDNRVDQGEIFHKTMIYMGIDQAMETSSKPKVCHSPKCVGEKYYNQMKDIGIANNMINSVNQGMKEDCNKLENLSAKIENSYHKKVTLSMETATSTTGAILTKGDDNDVPVLFSNSNQDVFIGEMILGAGDRAYVHLVKKCDIIECKKIDGHVFSKTDNMLGIPGVKITENTVSIASGDDLTLVVLEK